jgi:peptide/nickel transport system substrate-binding protein
MYRQSTSNARQSSVRLRYDRRHLMRMGAAGGALLAGGRWLTDPQHSVFAQADSGQLVISMFLEPTTLDPAQQVWVPGIVVLKNIIEPLIDLDDAGEAVPRLAESWEVSDDGTEWTWTLKEGITFHDGTPLDAEAVKFSFDRIMDPATQSQTGIALIGPYVGSEVIDARTVRMTYEEPYAPLLHNLSSVVLGIVSPTAVQELGENFAQSPVGTGPYVFQEWVRGDQVTMTRYEDYVNTSGLTQHDGPPYLETLVVKFIPEHQTRFAALQNGEINYMFQVPSLDVESMRTNPEFQVFENMFTGAPTMFLINRQLAPTDDLAVAQALQFAVNKDVITRIATAGVSPVAWGPLKPTNWSYDPRVEELYRYDPAMAAQLLDEAGWAVGADGLRSKDGQPGKLVINVKSDDITVSMLEAIQGMLQAVGLDLEIITMSLAASEDLARQGLNNLTFMDWRGTDPDILTVHYHSSNIGGWNMGYFDNAELDELLDTARATLDPDERFTMYQDAQMLIMEEAATLPLFNQVAVDAAQAGITGIRFDATKYYPEWYDAQWEG